MINRFVSSGRLVTVNAFHVFQNSNGQPNPSMLFRIAVRRNYRNRQGQYDADFFNCRAEGHNAQFLHQFVNIGDTVIVDGEIHQTTYTSHRFQDQQGNPARLHSIRIDVTDVQIAPSLKSLRGRNSNGMNPRGNNPRSPRPPMNNGGYGRPNNRFPRRNPRRNLPPTSRPQYRQIQPRPVKQGNRSFNNSNPMSQQTPSNNRFSNQRPINTSNRQPANPMNTPNRNSKPSRHSGKIDVKDSDLPF